MASFVLTSSGSVLPNPPLKLIDLGSHDSCERVEEDGFEALWTCRPEGKQLKVLRERERLLWIDGQVDRYPAANEPIENWLPGRWGSFRGFEIRRGNQPTLRAFVDPLGTRPIYYVTRGAKHYVSDKLSTLMLNLAGVLEVNWGAVLEAAVVGTLYSQDTTVEGAEQMKPGEVIEFRDGGTQVSFKLAVPEQDLTEKEVRADPAGTLLRAVTTAVRETWTDSEAGLLLSGGLDSRLALAVSPSGRKAMTVTTHENRESRVARQIAEICGAEFQHWVSPAEHYRDVLRTSFLITAAAADPQQAHHLGLGAQWRARGVRAITHAYLFDALLKGNRLFPRQRYVSRRTPLYGLLGEKAVLFAGRRPGRNEEHAGEQIVSTLRPEARRLLQERLHDLVSTVEPREVAGLETGLADLYLRSIPKATSYPVLLGWIEELDVLSPVFHPALWWWRCLSHPADLYKGKALRMALLQTGHPVTKVADTNTGRPPELPSRDWADLLRNQPFFPVLRNARDLLRSFRSPGAPAETDDGSWPPLAPVFREGEGLAILEEGLGFLTLEPFFDREAIWRLLDAYRAGDGRCVEPLLTLSAIGRWAAFARDAERHSGQRALRVAAGQK